MYLASVGGSTTVESSDVMRKSYESTSISDPIGLASLRQLA